MNKIDLLILFSFFFFCQNQISWIRRRDWHILSSGAQLYTNDERFAILHTPGSNTWTLQIKFVQKRDHGMYECQVKIKVNKIINLSTFPHPCNPLARKCKSMGTRSL